MDILFFSAIVIIIVLLLNSKNIINSFRRTDHSDITETPDAFNISEIYDIASDMEEFFSNTAHPKDLLDSEDFKQGVKVFNNSKISNNELYGYCTGENVKISCIAYEALNQRGCEADFVDQITANLKNSYLWPMYFALRILEYSQKAVIGGALVNAQDWWVEYKVLAQIFDAFIQERISKGEKPSFEEDLSEQNQDSIYNISQFLNQLDSSPIKPLLEEIEQLKITSLDSAYLNSVGHIWSSTDQNEIVVEHDYLLKILKQTEETLFKSPGRSVLMVGEPGVGKSSVVNMLAKNLENKGWKIFEASATDILAGQVYIGELEARIQKLIKNLDSKRCIIWYIPNFQQLHYAGKHKYSPTGVIDMILPFIENGKIKIIGEIHPTSNEKLSRDNKNIHASFEIIRLKPLEDNATLKLVKGWIEKIFDKKRDYQINDSTLNEALHLSKQFLNENEAPGNLFSLIKNALRQLLIEGKSKAKISTDDLYAALSQITGLPKSILDDQEGLDLNELRDVFRQRVMGQNEAIECLVERVAMIKSGLSDPSRPFGVFLFAGPTGTGKTEIAKALADFLFGSSDRMIRLDMSEFKTVESVDRILGDTQNESDDSALVNQIRKQPFSVILLDEFEKAHPNIWDLFLQVFDDGRLTDKRGNTSNFRHTIIIMTSNLGAAIKVGSNLGFNTSSDGYSIQIVEKAIFKTFRREFVNRIDRVVIFRPLSREVMRKILYNELNLTLQRRGLRNREWAVEWEDSAVDFLLEKGFTHDLGARPLKRAIERYLLSPLALTIVNHQFPSGDQFLFVKSDSKQIQVEFIDPDSSNFELIEEPETQKPLSGQGSDLSLKKIMLEPHGTKIELDFLHSSYLKLENSIKSEHWQNSKEMHFNTMSSAGFWESSERYKTLSEAEYMDRIESGFNTAESLINRSQRSSMPKNLVIRLAQQLYLLNEAYDNLYSKIPKDAFVKITSNPATDADNQILNEFSNKLKNMYLNWAKLRNMKHTILVEEKDRNSQKCSSILAFSGFGSFSILRTESGLHVFEFPAKEKRFNRFKIEVQVEPQPEIPVNNNNDLLVQATEVFENNNPQKTIVRLYREMPSPIVKDSLKKWRTGRLDKVLEGDFDLFS